MKRPMPQRIVIEFDDGSEAESPFDALPTPLQVDILSQPFASLPSPDPTQEKFLLLEWEDGWKEVTLVDPNCTQINRYYVISRPEDVGRLSINKGDGYPELIEIGRRPLNIKRITFLSTFHLTKKQSDREGKKIDHFFELSQEGDALSETLNDFRRVVEEEGIDLKDLRSRDQDQSGELYEKIRRKLGIKASSRQQDVYDFIAYLAGVQRPAS